MPNRYPVSRVARVICECMWNNARVVVLARRWLIESRAPDRGSVTRSGFANAVAFGKSERLEHPCVLQLTEPRSGRTAAVVEYGARVCDPQRLSQRSRFWEVQAS